MPQIFRIGAYVIVTLLFGVILVSGCGSVESRQNRESAASGIYSEIQTTERTETAEETEQSRAADAQEKRAYNSGSIYETIQEGEVNIIYSLTEEGGAPLAVDGSYSRYYVPAAAYREELRTLADELECSEKTEQEATAEWWENFHYEYLGILINYRGSSWKLYSDGKLLNVEDGLYLETNQPLCDMVLSILEEDLDIVPYNPKALNNIESATLLIKDSGTGEELCRKEVTDETLLADLLKMLTRADNFGFMGAGCPFSEYFLIIKVDEQTTLEFAMASDSCYTFFINGQYFDYHGTDEYNHQKYFMELLSQ